MEQDVTTGSNGRRDRLGVLIVGGGVAALEAMLALRDLAGDELDITVACDRRDFTYRPLAVLAPFGSGRARRFDLAQLVQRAGARIVSATVASVDVEGHRVLTDDSREIGYDVLVVAVGAEPQPALPGAITLWDGGDSDLERLMGRMARGQARRIVFANHVASAWHLPIYELALLTESYAREQGEAATGVRLAVATHESEPLELFGREASAGLRRLLERRGIELFTDVQPKEFDPPHLLLAPGGTIEADAVVAMPRLVGPRIAGLPADERGFLPIDEHCRVKGARDVYAAGDAAAFPVKQGGIAAQLADTAAESIAARIGRVPEGEGFSPVLRGVLLTGDDPEYLRNELAGGLGETSRISTAALWWPPGKIAGRHLSPYLASVAGVDLLGESPIGSGRPVEVAIGSEPSESR